MDRALTIFIFIWVAINIVLHIIGMIGSFYLHGFWGGITYIQETYSPFNVANFILTVAVLSPAFGAYFLREKLRKKRKED